ncbi:pilus assembly FimT family protein [Stratiformator vulcanicus]|uniref:Prepilin-type N-terminal cleavage/methylation domain-containing protein n=1 Tax=Stratiformator vulcanicus TaxID=2527980 RepID=A0A517R0V8_9PLAN|nr:prepilin-type N-terminal cleavage/methylation domain-containing protein [Stratiformator vulcanicus]QDT37535.1 hypothetical protein Pan189_19150 [Stratiformator vulcanicus]
MRSIQHTIRRSDGSRPRAKFPAAQRRARFSLPLISRLSPLASDRSGFTLIELLVVTVIVMILMTATFTVVSSTIDGDRVRGGARQLQSMLAGGRDRAIFSSKRSAEPRPMGVRFIKDENGDYCRSMVFVGVLGAFTEGRIQVDTGDNRTLGWSADWESLYDRGLLVNGTRLAVIDPVSDVEHWSTVVLNVSGPPSASTDLTGVALTRDYAGNTATNYEYKLLLAPEILQNEEPRLLPSGVVIDLASMYVMGSLPDSWRTIVSDGGDGSASRTARRNDTIAYSDKMDVLFSPRGTVYGSLSAEGLITFVLADLQDVALGFTVDEQVIDRTTGDPVVTTNANAIERTGDEILMTLATQTGAAFSSPIDVTITGSPPLRTDPFFFAETGEVAK